MLLVTHVHVEVMYVGIALTMRNSENDLKRHLSLFPEDSAPFEEENLNEQIQKKLCERIYYSLVWLIVIRFLLFSASVVYISFSCCRISQRSCIQFK